MTLCFASIGVFRIPKRGIPCLFTQDFTNEGHSEFHLHIPMAMTDLIWPWGMAAQDPPNLNNPLLAWWLNYKTSTGSKIKSEVSYVHLSHHIVRYDTFKQFCILVLLHRCLYLETDSAGDNSLKSVYLSSTYFYRNAAAHFYINGFEDDAQNHLSCSETVDNQADDDPWIVVDIGQRYHVGHVTLHTMESYSKITTISYQFNCMTFSWWLHAKVSVYIHIYIDCVTSHARDDCFIKIAPMDYTNNSTSMSYQMT